MPTGPQIRRSSLSGTADGRILGTPAYMSPEQARGQPVDKRTDIWAFGCVLFEMLSGQRVFDGATGTDTLAVVLQQEPDWSALPPNTPASVRRLLERCLQKDPRNRLHDIADARIELDDVDRLGGSDGRSPHGSPTASYSRPARLGRGHCARCGVLRDGAALPS